MSVKIAIEPAFSEASNPEECKVEAVMTDQQKRLVEFTEDGFNPGLLCLKSEGDLAVTLPFRALVRLQTGYMDYTPYERRDGDPECTTVPISQLHSVQWETFRETEPGKLIADMVRRILGQFMLEYQDQLRRRVDELEGSHLAGPDIYLAMVRALGEIDSFFAPSGDDEQDLERMADVMRCHVQGWMKEHNIIDIRHKFHSEDHGEEEGEDDE
jgi:hypothetical protein